MAVQYAKCCGDDVPAALRRFLTLVMLFFWDVPLLLAQTSDPQLKRELPDALQVEYCTTMHSPDGGHTTCVFVQYLISRDEWLLIPTAVIPEWIGETFSPYCFGSRFHCQKDRAELWQPAARSGRMLRLEELADQYQIEQNGLNSLFFTQLRSNPWQLPESAHEFIRGSEPRTNNFDHRFAIAFPGTELGMRVQATRQSNTDVNLVQSLERGVLSVQTRRQTLLKKFQEHAQPVWLPASIVVQSGNGRYLTWNGGLETPETIEQLRKMVVDPDQARALNLLFPAGAGGRYFELNWSSETGCAIPKEVTVRLGNAPGGMFLRSSRLLSASVIKDSVVAAAVDNIADSRAGNQPMLSPDLIPVVSREFWGKTPGQNMPNEGKFKDLSNRLHDIKRNTSLIGNQVLAQAQICVLAFATDTTMDRINVVQQLDEYLRMLNDVAVPEAVLASVFNLQEALAFWKRPDLVPVTWDLALKHAATWEPEQQLRVLIGAEQGVHGDALHAVLLVQALEAGWEARADPVVMRAAAIRAWMIYSRSLANAHLSKDAVPSVVPVHHRFVPRYRQILELMTDSDDKVLSDMSVDFLSDLSQLR